MFSLVKRYRLDKILVLVCVLCAQFSVFPVARLSAATPGDNPDNDTYVYTSPTTIDRIGPDGVVVETFTQLSSVNPDAEIEGGVAEAILNSTSSENSLIVRPDTGDGRRYVVAWEEAPAGAGRLRTVTDGVSDPQNYLAPSTGTETPTEEAANETEAEDTATTGDESVNCTGASWFGWFVCGIVTSVAALGDFLIQQFITPFLQTTPINISDGNNNIFKVWSTFRVIANIILVAALIFVIFGNAMGSGFAEAYLAKKSLPRIFIAAILINTSIYIAAGMIDITNVVGRSIGQLMMAPFNAQGSFLFQIGNSTGVPLSLALIGGSIWGIVGGVIPFLLLFVLLPAVVAMLAVFITLVMRQGLLLFLVIISPIAFALYALPNTAKYFGKWWDMFFKTLLVYPIVMVVIALSNILSVLVNEANSTSESPAGDMFADLVSIFLMIAPLFIIPFAFKMAGGLTGQIFGAVSGVGKKGVEAFKGNPDDPESLRRRVAYDYRSGRMQRRANMLDRLAEPSKAYGRYTNANGTTRLKKNSPLVRYPARIASKMLNAGNLAQGRGKMAVEQKKVYATQTGSGEDSNIRAFFAKEWKGEDQMYHDKDGKEQWRRKGHYYSPAAEPNGKYKEFKWADVKKSEELVRKDPSKLRAFASYEMGKAANDGQEEIFEDRLVERFNELGFTPQQADMVWDGIKGDNAGYRLERRWTDAVSDGNGGVKIGDVKHAQLSNDLAHRVRSWDFANFRSGTAKESLEGYKASAERIAQGTGTQADQDIVSNYTLVAEGVRRAFEARSASPGGEGLPEQGALVRGLGGSARADAAWKTFYEGVLGTTNGGQTPPTTGGGRHVAP